MEKFNENQNEVWRTIDEFPNYEVSNLGRVRNKKTNLIRKLTVVNKEYGYKQVIIRFSYQVKLLSRLVAKAFPEMCGEWHEDCEVHHLDFNPSNNRADNLKVCTVKEHHAYHGGENSPMFGKKLSEETRRKLSEAHKRICATMTDEEKKEKYGKIKGEKHPNYGKKFTDEHRRNMSIGRKDKKIIQQYSLEGEFIKEWESLHQINRELGLNIQNISACCRGKKKTIYKYIWKYKEK